ncbi:MAG: low molecular weight phosphotyrosine protein phosphatase [Acidobacteria bacterium]|nr:low molecular weight phosphotyrosine protein phosphatase [Acidobacteriota bacterium]
MSAAPLFALRRILVLCEGNHCRSPIAEALLRASLPGVAVESAGLGALEGHPADAEALRLLAERGLDHGAHRGRQFTPAMALEADLVFVMDRDQKEACEALVPAARGRVFLLGHWLAPERREIPDPFRRGPEAFRATLEHIEQSVAAWLPRLSPKADPA